MIGWRASSHPRNRKSQTCFQLCGRISKLSKKNLLELDSATSGIDAHGEIDEFTVDGEGEILRPYLASIPSFECFFGEGRLKGGAFEGAVAVSNHQHIVVTGVPGLT